MRIRMKVICETGALFDDGPRVHALPPAYEIVERHESDEEYDETLAARVNRR